MEATFIASGAIALLGAAGGAWGLVLARDAKRKERAPAPTVEPLAMVDIDRLERVLAKPVKLQPLEPVEVRVAEPDWHKKDLQISTIVERQPQPELEQLAAELARTNALIEKLLTQQPELHKRLEGFARLMAEYIEPLADLPNMFSRLMAQSGSSVTITQPPLLMVGGGNAGGGGAPPRRPAPRATPRANPGAPMPTPSIPASYVGGSVVVPPGEPVSLLALIQQQLSLNCPGSSLELLLSADESIMVGAASALGGPLSDSNFAFELIAGGPPRLYRSSFPGNSTPLGDLQVFAAAGGTLHVEVC